MKKLGFFSALLILLTISSAAQDWNGIPVPAPAPSGTSWQLNPVSDSFNYISSAGNRPAAFNNRWNDSYVNAFTGPSITFWQSNHINTNGSQLEVKGTFDAANNRIITGCMSSKAGMNYPMYMEARVKFTEAFLANNFWLININQTQEIDAMEAYPTSNPNWVWFDERVHISHHVFIRSPFQDYQPSDDGAWYTRGSGTTWRGSYHTYGVFWRDPFHLEYYIDGQLVRTVDGPGIIDPNNYTGGSGLNEPEHIIINMEQQSWHTDANRFPALEDLVDGSGRNVMLVDWVRVYDAVGGNNTPLTCDTAPDYNGNANSYSPGDRVVNTSDNKLYERTATGWNLIEDCNNSGGGGNNSGDLALGKNSFQSSTYQNNTNSFGSGRAVDGNDNTFNHTNRQQGAWWEVDLGSSQNIGEVKIWNRGNCCQNRLSNFDIIVYNQRGGNVIQTVTVNGSPSANGTSYNVNATGRVVRVQLRGNNFLHMDQVSVFAGSGGGNNNSGPLTCANAPAYNGNSDSYSVGDRVINGDVLYEKRADGQWNLIENCNSSKQTQLKPGQEEITANKMSIYPNPAKDRVSILLNNDVDKADLTILDLQGKVIFSKTFSGNLSNINTANFNKGLYIIRVNTARKIMTEKLIIK